MTNQHRDQHLTENPSSAIDDPAFTNQLILKIARTKKTEQIIDCCQEIQDALPDSGLSIYYWHNQQQFFHPLFCHYPRSRAELRARRLKIGNSLAAQAADCKPHRFYTLQKNSGSGLFMPLHHRRKNIGLVVLDNMVTPEPIALTRSMQILGQCIIQAHWRINETLYESKRNLEQQQLLQHTDEFFASWEKGLGWHFYNTPIPYRMGYTPEQQPLENIFGNSEIVAKADWQRCLDALEKCIATAKPLAIEYQLESPGGEQRTVKTKLRVLKKTDGGSAHKISALSVDTTEARVFVKSVTENTQLDAWLLRFNKQLYNDFNTRSIEHALKVVANKFGFDRVYIRRYNEQGQGKIINEWHAPNIPSLRDKLATAPALNIAPHQTFIIEDKAVTPLADDVATYNQAVGVGAQIIRPLYVDDHVLGHIAFQNIQTQRFNRLTKRASRAIADSFSMVISQEEVRLRLESSRQQYQMALEASSYGIWELDLRNNSIYLSPNYFAMIGYKVPKNLRFVPFSTRNIHFDDRDRAMALVNQLAEGKLNEFSEETRHLTATGDVIWMLMRGKVIKRDDRDHPIRAMGTLVDISDLKRTQTDLELAHQQALAAREAKSEFLARMSHEIRTPMNAVIGLTYLTQETDLNPQQKSYLADIDHAAKSLLEIIDDILDFSKIEAGKLILETHDFDLVEKIHHITDDIEPLAQAKGLTFKLLLDSRLPEKVIGDSTRLRQVLNSLLNNAVKFTSQGNVSLSVTVENFSAKGLFIHFRITDTGIGISETAMQHLFEAFTQADGSSSRRYGGTGLGLTIAKHLIELMGGKMHIASQQHQGTQCEFSLPFDVADSSSPTTAATSNDSSPDNGYNPLHGKHVLLVEDNPVNQKVARAILERHGMIVSTADNGSEALTQVTAAKPTPFDVILMDIEMPEMNGLMATEAIRQLPHLQKLPIVGMTAHAVDGNKQLYLMAGMTDCVSKPISPTGIYSVLEHCLNA